MVVGRLLVLNKHLGGWVKEIETGKFGYWGTDLQLPSYTHIMWLVVSTPLKNTSQLGLLFPIYGKIKMSQTTNQPYN